MFLKKKKLPKNSKLKNPRNIPIDYTISKLHTKFGNRGPYGCRDMMYLISIPVKNKVFFKSPKKPPKNLKFKNPRYIPIDYSIRKLHTKFGEPRPYSYRDPMYRKKKLSVFLKNPKNYKKIRNSKIQETYPQIIS